MAYWAGSVFFPISGRIRDMYNSSHIPHFFQEASATGEDVLLHLCWNLEIWDKICWEPQPLNLRTFKNTPCWITQYFAISISLSWYPFKLTKSLDPQGEIISPTSKLRWNHLLLWTVFLDTPNDMPRVFENPDFTNGPGREKVTARKLANEKELEVLRRDIMETPITKFYPCVYNNCQLDEDFVLEIPSPLSHRSVPLTPSSSSSVIITELLKSFIIRYTSSHSEWAVVC